MTWGAAAMLARLRWKGGSITVAMAKGAHATDFGSNCQIGLRHACLKRDTLPRIYAP